VEIEELTGIGRLEDGWRLIAEMNTDHGLPQRTAGPCVVHSIAWESRGLVEIPDRTPMFMASVGSG